jgi:hypothetical protein
MAIRSEVTMRTALRIVTALCLLSIMPAHAGAQSLSDQMFDLFVQSVVLARTAGGSGVVAHTPVFVDDPIVLATTGLVSQVSQQIGAEVSNIPLGTSAGGFTYTYDGALGVFSRTTESFGPVFAERAVTQGRGKFSFGMNYLHSRYDSLDGKDLQNGEIKFNLLHQPLTPPSYVEGDVVQAALDLKLTSDIAAIFLNYGVTNRFDVGLAVPLLHVTMDLTYRATILDFATHTASPTTHVFTTGSKTEAFNTQGSASGIGDIVVRGKYALAGGKGGGLAAGVDLRLPTGDETNMLGAGVTQARFLLIASSTLRGRVSPHANIGYTVASGEAKDQFNYVGGIEVAPSPKVTVVADVLGRTVRDTLRTIDRLTPHTFQQGPAAPLQTTTLEGIGFESGTLNSVLATAGVKVNAWQRLLISAHLLFPINEAGLRSRVTPVIGFDYAF